MTWPIELIGRNVPRALAVSVIASLLMPAVSRFLAPTIPVIVVIVLTVAFLRIDVARAIAQWRRPERLALWIALLLVVLPLAMYPLARLAGLGPDLVFLLVLLAAGPPLGAATNFALMLKLDAELALNLLVGSTMAFPFVAPLLVFAVLDFAVEVEPVEVFARLAGTIIAALAIAQLLRWRIGAERIAARHSLVDGFAALGMIAFIMAIMVGIPEMLVERPEAFLRLLVASSVADYGLCLVLLGLALVAAKISRRPPSLAAATVAMISGNRNLGLFLTALPAGLAAEITPFIAIYQIPIFLTPLVMAPVYAWYTKRARAGNQSY